jgi:hypothetical protein
VSDQGGPPPSIPTAPLPPEPGPEAGGSGGWIVAGAVVIAAIAAVIIILIASGGDEDSDDVATGPAVAALQEHRTMLGDDDGPINGTYDEATQLGRMRVRKLASDLRQPLPAAQSTVGRLARHPPVNGGPDRSPTSLCRRGRRGALAVGGRRGQSLPIGLPVGSSTYHTPP